MVVVGISLGHPGRKSGNGRGVVKSFGGSGGGFLNVGTPEMFVVGAVAWAILGPKELFKLAKQVIPYR